MADLGDAPSTTAVANADTQSSSLKGAKEDEDDKDDSFYSQTGVSVSDCTSEEENDSDTCSLSKDRHNLKDATTMGTRFQASGIEKNEHGGVHKLDHVVRSVSPTVSPASAGDLDPDAYDGGAIVGHPSTTHPSPAQDLRAVTTCSRSCVDHLLWIRICTLILNIFLLVLSASYGCAQLLDVNLDIITECEEPKTREQIWRHSYLAGLFAIDTKYICIDSVFFYIRDQAYKATARSKSTLSRSMAGPLSRAGRHTRSKSTLMSCGNRTRTFTCGELTPTDPFSF